jgi:hypothetical protein
MSDYDSPWKEALELYFRAFLAFFFPAIHNDIDWSRGWESLDKELQQVAPEAAQGRRYVDKLLRVWLKDGGEAWVLIHVEVQTTREAAFPERMFVYFYRLFDRYNRRVCSLAVLADEDPGWRPGGWEQELWGCSLRLAFPSVKLLDWAGRDAELEAEGNPFARVVLAHLKAMETRRDEEARLVWKLRLVRGPYERGLDAEDVRKLFRLIDWLLELPQALEEKFWDEVQAYQQERTMPFITTPERVGFRRALLQVIEDQLRLKFKEHADAMLAEIRQIYEPETLRAITVAIVTANNPDEIRRVYAEAPPPASPPTEGG